MHERDRTETVHAKFVVGQMVLTRGPQGAWDHDGWGADRFVFQSGIRRRAPTCRAFADFIWGVLDMVPSAETDFPDYRNKAAIHSDNGSCMIIPRERRHDPALPSTHRP